MLSEVSRSQTVYPFVVKLLQDYVKVGDRLLDVGCGPCQYRSFCPGTYVGLDLNGDPYPPGQPRQVDLIGSAMDIPEADARFDCVMCVSSFYQIPDPGKALAEFMRVLKPGGRVLLVDYNRRVRRRLSLQEGVRRESWTQLKLKNALWLSGFAELQMLLPREKQPAGLVRWIYLLREEIFGSWSIVVGKKSADARVDLL